MGVDERGNQRPALAVQSPGQPPRPRIARRQMPFDAALPIDQQTGEPRQTAIGSDRTVRYICARTYPDWQRLRRFRRQHRELLLQCLVYVLKQGWALKFDEGDADYAGYEWFESELIDLVNRGAQDRLDFAALLDGAESE